MLLTHELLDAADFGELRPRWDGPFTVTASGCPSPNTCKLAVPRRMRRSLTGKVDIVDSNPFVSGLMPLRLRALFWTGGKEGEHDVELLLNCTTRGGDTRYVIGWNWHKSADDACQWLRVEEPNYGARL